MSATSGKEYFTPLSDLPVSRREMNQIAADDAAWEAVSVKGGVGWHNTNTDEVVFAGTPEGVPDDYIYVPPDEEVGDDYDVVESNRGATYRSPKPVDEDSGDNSNSGAEGDGSTSTGDLSEQEVIQTTEGVADAFLERDLSPEANTTEELNNGFCNAVAQNIFEEAGEPEGMQIMEADTLGGRHQWVSYNGRHYDAEVPSGVDDFEDLPVWDRFGNPDEARVVEEGGEGAADEGKTVDVNGTEVAEGSDVDVSIEGSGSVSGVVDEIVDVDGTPWLMVEGEDSGRINQYPITKIDSVSVKASTGSSEATRSSRGRSSRHV